MRVTAKEGYVLTNNNKDYTKEVYIGKKEDAENWKEVPESEATNITQLTGLDAAKAHKVAEIEQADKTVSIFFVNDIGMWVDKELRNSLLNVTLPALKAAGATTTELWYEGIPPTPITVPIDLLVSLIPQLELQAKAIYDNTNRLKAAVYTCETEEELSAFQIAGYPDPLKFEL